MALGAHPVPMPGPALAGPFESLTAVRGGVDGFITPFAAQRRKIPAAGLVASLDVGINRDQLPNGLDAFLALRITVKNVLVVAGFAAGIMLVTRAAGLYDASRVRRWGEEVRRLFLVTIPITVMAAVVPIAGQSNASVDRMSLLLFWSATLAGLVVTHAIRSRLTHDAPRRRAIVIGTGPRALRIYRALSSDSLTSYSVIGFVDDTADTTVDSFIGRRTLGRLEDLESVLVAEHVDEVWVGLPLKSYYHRIQDAIRTCEHLGVKVLYPADIVDTALAKPSMQTLSGSGPQVQLQMAPEGVLVAVKRGIDILGASAALILLSPLLLVTALAIRLTSDGPAIYAQQRYGLNRRIFRMFKFRTMVQDADRLQASLESRNEASGPVFKIADDPRVTPLGRFLRRSSIDELPQLFNVLRGDMSLVGPRPLPLRDVSRFTRTGDLRRFSVRPGVTCLWQISGRSGIGYDEWIALDLQYIDRWSLWRDMLILVRTIPAVLRGTGAQ